MTSVILVLLAYLAGSTPSGLLVVRAFTGEDIRRGDTVLEPGTLLGPAQLGMLASLAGMIYGDVSSISNWILSSALRSQARTRP